VSVVAIVESCGGNVVTAYWPWLSCR